MKLHDPNFLTFAGEPISGIAPPQLLVYGNDGVLNGEQQAWVRHAYKLFRDDLRVSLGSYLVQHRRMADGSLLRMVSNNGLDQVEVWVASQGGLRLALYPAFWYNAPTTAESIPDPLHVGTWTNLPYASGMTLKSKQDFWQVQPGNRTWRDTRPECKAKGLVLSWWGLGRDNYSDWVHPDTAVDPPYNRLYCNGTVIGEFDSDRAIMGACILEVDGVLKVAVTTSLVYSGVAGGIGLASNIHIGATSALWWWWNGRPDNGYLIASTSHADLPAQFHRDFAFKKLAFTLVHTLKLSGDHSGNPFTYGGVGYNFYSPGNPPIFAPTLGIRFNESGTEGIIAVAARVYTASDPALGTTAIDGVKVDPRSGAVTNVDGLASDTGTGGGIGSNTDPGGYFGNPTGSPYPPLAMDYEGDEFVWAAQRLVYVSGVASNAYLYHSKYGVLMVDVDLNAYKWLITGDLRAGMMHFVGVGGTGAFPQVVIHSFLKGAFISTVTRSYPHVAGDSLADGYEGCDSSFDGRMIVDRWNGSVAVYVDGADVTSSLEDERIADIRYPVLCGPMRFAQGRFTQPPKGYVAGAAP